MNAKYKQNPGADLSYFTLCSTIFTKSTSNALYTLNANGSRMKKNRKMKIISPVPTSLLHLYSELDPSYHLLALCSMQLMNDSDRADCENKEPHLTHVLLRWKK